jgi:hypothetical protein
MPVRVPSELPSRLLSLIPRHEVCFTSLPRPPVNAATLAATRNRCVTVVARRPNLCPKCECNAFNPRDLAAARENPDPTQRVYGLCVSGFQANPNVIKTDGCSSVC